MLTTKSDRIVGRAKASNAIVNGTEIPESTIPERFKVLVRELNALGLNIIPKGVILAKDSPETDTKAGEKFAEILGAEAVATDELTSPTGNMEVVNAN